VEFDWYCTRQYEAKKLLGVSLGFKRPEVSLLERKETYRVTFDAS
jgi:hypothetical protein